MKEVSKMKEQIRIFDLKKYSGVYMRGSILFAIVMFILLFNLFPQYAAHPYIIKDISKPISLEPTEPIINPVIPKPIQKPKIPVEADNGEEIDNVIIPPDSILFQKFGETDPNVIPPPNTFIPCEKYPEIKYAPPPQYPKIALAAGIEGKVYLQIFVGKDGIPKKILVADSDVTPDCDSAAVKSAWNYRFEPAMQRDRPIGVWISMPVVFRLK
jgi:protein TonB